MIFGGSIDCATTNIAPHHLLLNSFYFLLNYSLIQRVFDVMLLNAMIHLANCFISCMSAEFDQKILQTIKKTIARKMKCTKIGKRNQQPSNTKNRLWKKKQNNMYVYLNYDSLFTLSVKAWPCGAWHTEYRTNGSKTEAALGRSNNKTKPQKETSDPIRIQKHFSNFNENRVYLFNVF